MGGGGGGGASPPWLRPPGRSPKALRCSGAPYGVLTKHLPDIHIGKWNDRFFLVPVAAAEHRSRNREKRASCLSPWRVFYARRVEASADSGEKRKEYSAAPGRAFFWFLFFARAKKRNLPWVSHPQVVFQHRRKRFDRRGVGGGATPQ